MKTPLSRSETHYLPRWRGYGMAAVVTLAILSLRLLLHPVLQETTPLTAFILAAIISGWYGGFGPGLLATVLGAVLGTVFFLEPHYGLDTGGVVRLVLFFVTGITASGLAELLHRARAEVQAGAIRLQWHADAMGRSEERLRLAVQSASLGTWDYISRRAN